MTRAHRSRSTAALTALCAAALPLLSGIPKPAATAAETSAAATTAAPAFRPPAVPLVTFDPYLSIWSENDHLYDGDTKHWTRTPHPLTSLIRVDGKTYRLMGAEPAAVPPLPQTGLTVLPTRSIYTFGDGHVAVTLTFMTPALPNDLKAVSLPLSYLTWDVKSTDGAPHAVQVFDSVSGLLTVNRPEAKVTGGPETAVKGLTVLRIGADQPTLLRPAGDRVRINWGYAYLAAPQTTGAAVAQNATLADAFASTGKLPLVKPDITPTPAQDGKSLGVSFDLGKVGAKPVERHAMVAYDEIWAVDWFYTKLRPYWKRHGESAVSMLEGADKSYPSLVKRCAAFDSDLMADLTKTGGRDYATLGALAYRQCLAGCGLAADANGKPLLFTKENTSNGDLATVDVIFPMDPIWLVFSPTLAKASLVPVLDYAKSPHWKFPNAPHDLGTYPVAHGRDDGGEGMPVEESGNMLLLCDAIAREEGNPSFVAPWWPQLTSWAKYLESYGEDPENQLCTDDFMGHLAHNANLSVKAILALAAYGDLCRMRGETGEANRYLALAKEYAGHWQKAAANDTPDSAYRLAFDKPDTWSQKYNLVWDKILGFHLFPPAVAAREVAHYKTVLQPYGVPLDSRTHLTKSDWTVWSATLADKQSDFEQLIHPMIGYLNETTTRDPFSDSYVTDKVSSGGMHARPVIGGIFVKMLAEPVLWKKWSSRDTEHVTGWAPLPKGLTVTTVALDAPGAKSLWRYTTTAPGTDSGWQSASFDDSSWQEGAGPFGSAGTPGIAPSTVWKTGDIYLRRKITLPANLPARDALRLLVYHDEDAEVYVDGILAGSEAGYDNAYIPWDIAPAALAHLKPGATVTLAVHCHQTKGGQGIDVGLASVTGP